MSKYFFSTFIFFLFLSCSENNSKNNNVEIEIKKKNFYFGKISMNDTIFRTIEIKNIGLETFKIDSVGVSCGCSMVYYDKTPKKINETAFINVKFIPDKIGFVDKTIVVEGNTNPPFNIFHLKGEVK